MEHEDEELRARMEAAAQNSYVQPTEGEPTRPRFRDILTNLFWNNVFAEILKRRDHHRKILYKSTRPFVRNEAEILWPIDNFASRSAITAGNDKSEWRCVYSPTILVEGGYAIRIRLYPNGDDDHKDWLSVVVQLMPPETLGGEAMMENGAIPVYPMRVCLSFVIMDQSGLQYHQGHTISTMVYPDDPATMCFLRPQPGKENPCFGVRKLISVQKLWENLGLGYPRYVKDDTIWVGLGIRPYAVTFTGMTPRSDSN